MVAAPRARSGRGGLQSRGSLVEPRRVGRSFVASAPPPGTPGGERVGRAPSTVAASVADHAPQTGGKPGPGARAPGPSAGGRSPGGTPRTPSSGAIGPTSGAIGPTSGATGPTSGTIGPTSGTMGPGIGSTRRTSGRGAPTIGARTPTIGGPVRRILARARTSRARGRTSRAQNPTVTRKNRTAARKIPTAARKSSVAIGPDETATRREPRRFSRRQNNRPPVGETVPGSAMPFHDSPSQWSGSTNRCRSPPDRYRVTSHRRLAIPDHHPA
jgi:hypothetical protein